MTSESTIMATIFRDHGATPGLRLFRNQVGEAWMGRIAHAVPGLPPGSVVLLNARRVTMGWGNGSSDILGCQRTPGGIAQLVAIETKVLGGRVTPVQTAFLDAVKTWGGLSGVARSSDDAAAILAGQ